MESDLIDHEQLAALFDRAMAIDEGARAELIDRLERSDAAIAARLRVLVHFASLTDPLESAGAGQPVAAPGQSASGVLIEHGDASSADAPAGTERMGASQLVGPYRLDRRLDRDGPHEVWAARRGAHPYDPVAIKFMPPGVISEEARWRFSAECAALANVTHPNVAQLRDVGTAGDGRAWIAIELIDGLELVTHCRGHRLDEREIVELMTIICDAVQAMHQRGVLHRDLKPANVLVSRHEVGGMVRDVPKVIDFGVARVLREHSTTPIQSGDQRGAEADVPEHPDEAGRSHALYTATGQLLGTLPYMSPEALGGKPRDVDARSDIYALGVILFELLAGRRPFDLATLPVPGRVKPDEAPPDLGAARASCRGDLARVVGKAMAFDRTRRYASASELAADLRRWTRHEPVTARPTSLLHNALLFARRQRSLTAAAIVIAALVGTVMVTLVENARSTAARLSEAQSMLGFVTTELLPTIDGVPGGAKAQDQILSFVLAATEPGALPAADPFRRWMRAVALLEQSYRDPGSELERSEQRLVEALALLDGVDALDESDGRDRADHSDDRNGIDARDTDESPTARPVPGRVERDLLRARILVRQGLLRGSRGDLDGHRNRQSAARTLLESLGREHPHAAQVWVQLGFVHDTDGALDLHQGLFDSATRHFDRMEVAIDRVRAVEPEHPSLNHLQVNLALLRGGLALSRRDPARGDLESALREYQRGVTLAEERVGAIATDRSARVHLVRCSSGLAEYHFDTGRVDEGIAVLNRALPHAEWLFGVDAGGPLRAELIGGIHESVGRAWLRLDKPNEALCALDDAVRYFAIARSESVDANQMTARLGTSERLRSLAMTRLGMHDEACRSWLRATELYREAAIASPSVERRISFAAILVDGPCDLPGSVETALEMTHRLTTENPLDPFAWDVHARVLRRAQEPDAAIDAARRALDVAGTRERLVRPQIEALLVQIAAERSDFGDR